jgi:hypothetical protein
MAGRGAKKRNDARRVRHGRRGAKRAIVTRTTPRPVLFQVKLETVPAALNSLESVIKAFAENKIKRAKYTGLIYGMNSIASLLRLKQEGEIVSKIAKLEKLIEEVSKR